MKVLHINNIAGVASNLVKGLREHGIQADLMVRHHHPYGYPFENAADVRARDWLIHLLKKAIQYDVIHIHDLGYPEIHNLHIHLIRVLRSKVIVHFHGSALRERHRDLTVRILPKICRVLVSTTDLLDYVEGAEWLPNPIDRAIFYPSMIPGKGCLYCRKHYEGVEKIERARSIAQQEGQDLYIMEESISWEKMPGLYQSFSTFIDQSTFPALSLMALEALASGLDVIKWDGSKGASSLLARHDLKNVAKELIGIYDE